MIKKTGEVIKIIEEDGWYFFNQEGSHKQYKHPTKKGKVTIPYHGKNEVLHHKVVSSIFKQADIKIKSAQ